MLTVEQIAKSIPMDMLALTSRRLRDDVIQVYRCSHIKAEAAVEAARRIQLPDERY